MEREAATVERLRGEPLAVREDDDPRRAARRATGDEPVRELTRRRLLDRRRRQALASRSRANSSFARVKILAHLDLDAFFAAVEELEDPSLRDKPLVVGGDPHGRGVVSTANYAARTFGIHSAMSAAEALRRCPHAVFLRPRHALYRQYSRVVWDTVGEIVPRVERTGIDEGYLDLAHRRDGLHSRAGRSRRRSRPPFADARASPARSASGRRRSSARSPPTAASRAA